MGRSGYDTATLLQKVRDEKPGCRVCGRPCDPDDELKPVMLLMIPLDELSREMGMIPVHAGVCEREARDRMERAQADVEERKRLTGTEHVYDKAQRLKASGEALDLG